MSRLPELGESITLADYESDPWLLVVAVDVPVERIADRSKRTGTPNQSC
ncbi:hypothetical protein [Haloarcula montana]|nr:hypothetical protein [Haloarcula sp. GH36]